MKSKGHTKLLFPAFLLLVIISCSKSKITQDVKPIPFPAHIAPGSCNIGPDYGATIICAGYRGPNNDHKIKPKNNPGPGLYYAWPEGLVIDHTTGEINVTQSENRSYNR